MCHIYFIFLKAKIMVFVLHKKEAKELCNSINKYKDYIMSLNNTSDKFQSCNFFGSKKALHEVCHDFETESDSDDDDDDDDNDNDGEKIELAEDHSELNAQSIKDSSNEDDDDLQNENFPRKNYAYCLHGDMSKSSRNFVFQSFNDNEFPVLVCTDIASRGLNFSSSIDLVINMSVGMNIEAFVHRSGRTGRAGKV